MNRTSAHTIPSGVARALLVMVTLLLLPGPAKAGRGDKAGTAAASQLLVPVGAASIAEGSSVIASASGLEALYWNPAGLSRTAFGTMATVSHMTYIADISVDYFAAGTRLGDLATGAISVKTFSIGQIPVTTEEQPDGTGETVSPTMLVVGGTLARNISDRIALGVTAKYIYEKMGTVSAGGFGFDVGVQYDGLGGIDGLEFGVTLKNLGPRMRYDGTGLLREAVVDAGLLPSSPVKIQASSDELPSSIEIGLSYAPKIDEVNAVRISSAFRNNNFSEDEYGFGGEYSYSRMFFARLGYNLASGLEGREYIFGPTFGFGVKTSIYDLSISVDYAFRSAKYFSGNHVVTLSIGS